MHCAPKYHNIMEIHLLSDFSSDPYPGYITSGTQQLFVPAPGACISYQAHRAFSSYLADLGWISVSAERAEAIDTLIPEHFNLSFSMDKESPLHTSSFNMVSKMTRSSSEKLPAFLQCSHRTKFGTIPLHQLLRIL